MSNKKMHKLKTWPFYFGEVWEGKKNFEVRKNDRDFKELDTLLLQEYDPKESIYTGRSITAVVTTILPGGSFGIQTGYCVLGMRIISLEKF